MGDWFEGVFRSSGDSLAPLWGLPGPTPPRSRTGCNAGRTGQWGGCLQGQGQCHHTKEQKKHAQKSYVDNPTLWLSIGDLKSEPGGSRRGKKVVISGSEIDQIIPSLASPPWQMQFFLNEASTGVYPCTLFWNALGMQRQAAVC